MPNIALGLLIGFVRGAVPGAIFGFIWSITLPVAVRVGICVGVGALLLGLTLITRAADIRSGKAAQRQEDEAVLEAIHGANYAVYKHLMLAATLVAAVVVFLLVAEGLSS